jgi:putative ABC transport system permease protein
MNIFFRIWGVFLFTTKRILAQKGLTLAVLLGFTTATALTMSIPIYADAAYQKILERDVIGSEETAEDSELVTGSSSFPFMFRYIGSWNGLIPWDQIQAVDQYLSNQAIIDLGLPIKQLVRFFRTDYFPFVAGQEDAYSGSEYRPLAWLSLASLSNWDEHVTFLEGNPPASAPPAPEGSVNVWIKDDLATEVGLQVGETYRLLGTFNDELYKGEIPVHIAGVWEVKDPEDDFWFYKPSEFRYILLTSEDEFVRQGIPTIDGELDLALWYMNMDNSGVHSRDVPTLLRRISNVRARAGTYLTNTRMDVSPEDRLREYMRASSALMIFLYILNIPLLAMILAFIGLVGGMMISQRLNEIAVLRSRGASIFQVVGFSLLECLVIGMISLVLGGYLALKIAGFFGSVSSFLNFSAAVPVKTTLSLQAIQMGLITVGLAILAQLGPTFNAARHTIITYKQELARQMRPPWWQRVYLDIFLLVPAAYGIYVLRQQGGLNLPVSGGYVTQDPFQNPLLILVPSLGIFALTLLILRLLPYIMALFARLVALTPSIGILAAARHLARTTGNYHAPLILLILTLSLSTFTSTLAQTLDKHLNDQHFYEVGSDARLIEFGDMPTAGTSGSTQTSDEQGFWVFLPVNEHLKAPGVNAAARVARSEMTVFPPIGPQPAVFFGIDRVDFSRSAFWREDFASISLGELMNQLALTTEGVLVPRSFLETHRLKPGDNLPASLYKLGSTHEMTFKIVGAFDYFPTWYPDEGPLLVANLDYVFEQVGGEFPYDVWLSVNPDADNEAILDSLNDIGLNISYSKFSGEVVQEAKLQPERQGLFGLLSVGFTALAFLTTLGFLLYAFFSFRRRFIELGILRAIGLSAGQMMVLLGVELAILLGIGLVAGTVLGVGVSNLFIPYLQVGTEQTAHIPPFLVQIDWSSVFQVYFLFILLFITALSILAVLLLRMKVFQAVKLGETV